MCIIAIKPSNRKMFDEDVIRTMFEHNSDGAGIMYLTPDKLVHIEKGFFKVEPLLTYIRKNKKLLSNTDVILHFRIATSGKKNAVGCHPYPIWSKNVSDSVDVSLAMAHNGMLDACGWKGTNEINDTEVFIRETLRKLPHNFYKNKSIMDLISKSIAHNKLAFLSKDGIYTIGDFIEDGGYLFSNTSYKKYQYPNYINYHQTPIYSKPKVTEVKDKSVTKKTLETLFGNKDEIELMPKSFEVIQNYFEDNKASFRKLDDGIGYGDDVTYYDDEYMYVCYPELCQITKYRISDDEDTVPLF